MTKAEIKREVLKRFDAELKPKGYKRISDGGIVRNREKTIKRDEIIPLSSTQLIEIRGNGKTTEVAKATLDIITK